MSSKHAPGPWTIEKVEGGWGVRAPNWGYVAVHEMGSLPHWEEGQAANRHLIAAAPDLLESLVAVEALFGHIATDSTQKYWLDYARAAIAKANGDAA